MPTPQAHLAAAHAAIARGDLASARRLLVPLISPLPDASPDAKSAGPQERSPVYLEALNALAVIERRLGNLVSARKYFEQLLQARPNDPQIHNNYANFLREADAIDAAIKHYRLAVTLRPDYLEALLNLGLALKSSGQADAARDAFERGVRLAPSSTKAWQCLGGIQRDLGNSDAAVQALDRALALDPRNVQAAYTRALLEAELGRPAAAFYAWARALAPDEPEIVLGHAVAKYEEGDSGDALAMLGRLTTARPDWVKGHAALAQMRWQSGDTETFAHSFDTALAARPQDIELQVGCFGTLMRAGQYASVLARLARARAAIDAPELFDRYEAVCASESGDVERADRAFARQLHVQDRGLQIAYVRHLLRTRRVPEAARFAETLIEGPAADEAWPYLGIAWRLTEDPRSRWLHGEQGFVAHFDMAEIVPRLERIARVLEGIHHGRIHPFDQSLRGGTQTDGQLFRRHEPELVELRKCIEAGIERYIAQLPGLDARHPFLRHRAARFGFVGSYSVRLRANGYHINHMHPDAWISCCLYVDMPASIGVDSSDPAGWLTIGCPPRELGIELSPLTRVRPEPGRLAVFPSFMWHGTAPFSAGERLTVVSDFAAVHGR